MRSVSALLRLLPLGLALILFLLLLAPPTSGQESPSADYLKQLRGRRQESWLTRETRRFQSFAHLDRAHRLMQAGRLPEARQELENYLTIAPQDAEARYSYLLLLYKMKDYAGTIRQADELLQGHPEFVPAFLYRGLAQQALGRVEKAQEDFQSAARQAQTSPEDRSFALNMVADLALRQKNYALALSTLEELQKSGTEFNLTFRRGLALEGLGHLADAEQAYRLAQDQARSTTERLRVYLSLGELARKRQDWAGASQAFQEAGDLAPDNPEVWRSLAQVAYSQKDYAASADYIERALALKSDPEDRDFLINVLGFLRDYRKVTERLTRLLAEAQTPEERLPIYSSLGYAYNKWGKFAEAERAFQAAADLKPDIPTLEALAQARERGGHLSQAIAAYRQILQRQPAFQVHLKLGLLLEKTGDYQAAVSHLEKAADGTGPSRFSALKELGFLYGLLTLLSKSCNYYECLSF